MRQDRFSLVGVTSLVLCTVAVALWVRSFATEAILWESDRGRFLIIGIDGAPASAVRASRDAVALEQFLIDLQSPPFAMSAVTPPGPREARLFGFLWVRGETGHAFQGTRDNGFWIVGVPYWFIVIVSGAPALQWMWLHARTARRRRLNLCAICGYDLRATSERCPECGDEAPAARPAA